jgi:hypothetical protein
LLNQAFGGAKTWLGLINISFALFLRHTQRHTPDGQWFSHTDGYLHADF